MIFQARLRATEHFAPTERGINTRPRGSINISPLRGSGKVPASRSAYSQLTWLRAKSRHGGFQLLRRLFLGAFLVRRGWFFLRETIDDELLEEAYDVSD